MGRLILMLAILQVKHSPHTTSAPHLLLLPPACQPPTVPGYLQLQPLLGLALTVSPRVGSPEHQVRHVPAHMPCSTNGPRGSGQPFRAVRGLTMLHWNPPLLPHLPGRLLAGSPSHKGKGVLSAALSVRETRGQT